ncbi:MAG: hypothetical protein WBB36_15535, partial [Chitinophagales bacterium]
IAFAQQPPIQNFRHYDQKGLNVFETGKSDTTLYTGFKLRLGLNSSFTFQDLNHENIIDTNQVAGTGWHLIDNTGKTSKPDGIDDRTLIGVTNGFNLAMANLNLDAQLYDGIHMNLITYLSTRHHSEAWVKGGYIQFDKLTFLKSDMIDNMMEYLTIKFGDYEVNYGDQHYRRSDAGNSMYNPFVENLILDDFTTEIGGELQFHNKAGFLAVVEMTGGEIKGDVAYPVSSADTSGVKDANTGEVNKRSPSFIAKLGYDKQFNPDLRFRITGSVYTTKSSVSNTLFAGDRSGSHYFMVLENYYSSIGTNAFSGRLSKPYGDQLTAFMINPFVKFHGLELFGTLEFANGRNTNEKDSVTNVLIGHDRRQTTQYAVDVIYRFTQNENFWLGLRYNGVSAELPFTSPAFKSEINTVNVTRFTLSAGWYILDNVMAKVEYVTQMYKDYPTYDQRNEGKFSGIMIEAALGF